jgi:PAS domain S-box-containing protein
MRQSMDILSENSKDWKQIIDAIPDLIFILDTNYRMVWVNRATYDKLDLPVEDVVGKKCYNIIHDRGTPPHDCPFGKVVNGEPICHTAEIMEKNLGGLFLVSVSPFYNAAGLMAGVIHVARDITDVRQVENGLRESEARYRALAEATFDAVFISEKGVCLDANQRAVDMFGYAYDELIGIFGPALFPPSQREMVSHHIFSGFESPYEAMAQKKDGTLFHTEIRGKTINYQNKVFRVTAIQDIDRRKQTEAALSKSVEKYRTLVENIPDVIFSTDERGNIFDLHLPAETFYGYKISEMLGKHYSAVIYDDDLDSVLTKIRQALHDRSEFLKGVQHRVVSKDGRLNWVEANLHMQFDSRRICIRTDIIVRDIGELKQAQADLQRSNVEMRKAYEHRKILSTRLIELLEKDRRQIANEIHDRMGQSLSALRTGFSTITSRLEKCDGDLLALVKSVEEKTVQELINLKNVSYELRTNILDHLGLAPAIRTLITDVEKGTDLRIRFFTKNIPREMNPDKSLALYRIAQESLTNIVRHSRATDVFVSLIKQADMVLLSIEDNGVGFDQADTNISADGRGLLGIHIMKERAAQVDGDLTVESQPGKGTQVMTEVPL